MTTTAVSTRRLLLVDDDEDACRLLGEVLERESYEIIRALSVEEAIAKYHREGPFDAVLTDLRMPGASGLDLLQHVRRIDPDVLVLVLTAFGDAAAAGGTEVEEQVYGRVPAGGRVQRDGGEADAALHE